MSDAQIPDLSASDGRSAIDEAIWRAYLLGRAVERSIWKRRGRRAVAT